MGVRLIELMGIGQTEFSRRFRNSPAKRAERALAVALGNWHSPKAVPVLTAALGDEEPLIRGHAAWALGRIGTDAALEARRGRLAIEEDAWVRSELELEL